MSALPPPPPSYGSSSRSYVGPYGNVMPARRPVQSLEGLSLATSILLAVVAVTCVVGIAAYAHRASVIDDFLRGSGPLFSKLDEIEDADGTVAATTVVYGLVLLATAAVFIPWQFRHARNAEAIVGRWGLGSEWAIAGWFIPCANYVLPGIELFQSSKASDAQLDPRAPTRAGQGSPLVIAWAIAFGLGSLLFATSRVLFPDEDELAGDLNRVDEAIDADRLAALSFFVLAVAAVLAILMVRSLSKRQAAKAVALPTGGGYGYGYPSPPGAGYPGGPAAPGYVGGHSPPPGWGTPASPPGPGGPGPGAGWPPPPGSA